MSADVWLEVDGVPLDDSECPTCDLPPRGPHAPQRASAMFGVHAWNLTYNLSPMLHDAGMPSWHHQLGRRGADLGPVLAGVAQRLHADPDRFRVLNPANGWGDYDGAFEVIRFYAAACIVHPDAVIGGWL